MKPLIPALFEGQLSGCAFFLTLQLIDDGHVGGFEDCRSVDVTHCFEEQLVKIYETFFVAKD